MDADLARNDDPWNDDKAAHLIGKTALMRLVTVDPARQVELSRTHHFGTIVRCDLKEGIFLRQSDGSELAVPPFTGSLQPAESGTYTLPDTGETVTNPDFWATWVREA